MVLKITVRPWWVQEPPQTAPGGGGTGTDAGTGDGPGGRFPASAGEAAAFGHYPGEEDLPGADQELDDLFPDGQQPPENGAHDLAPSIQRRKDERGQLDKFLSGVAGVVKDPSSLLVGMAEAGTIGENQTAQREVRRANAKQSWLDAAAPAVKDIAKGITEAPRQIIGGVRDAIDATAKLGQWLAEDGVFVTEKDFANDPGMNLPDVKQADSTTGGIVRSVSQFLAGFVGAGKITAPLKIGRAAAGVAKGAVADFTAFDAHEKRLSDLIQEFPALQNPVTEYLASKGTDGEIEGRLKRAVEGMGVGAATEGLLLALRAIRKARVARAAEQPEQGAAQAAAQAREAAPLNAIGDAADAYPAVSRLGPADMEVPLDVAAKALTDKGLTPLGSIKDGVFINFAKINTSDDIKRVISDTANAFKDDIDALRRGTRSNAATADAAKKLDAWDILAGRRAGDPLNAEQSLAVRNLWEASGRKLLEVSELAARQPSPENLFQFRKMLEIHRTVQGEVIAARTETGRALQAWTIPAGGTREQMAALDDIISKAGGLDFNAAFAAKIAALKDAPNGLAALDAFVEKSRFAKTLDALVEARTMALLSGPKTHMVNMMSNIAVMGQQIVERWAAARWGQLFGTGDVPIGEAAAQWFGMTSAIKDAFRYAGQTFMSGRSGYGMNKLELPFDRAISSSSLKIPGDSWLGKGVDAIGTAINLPGRALLAEDEFFKTIGFRMEIHAQAFRTASREVADGTISHAEMKGRIADLIEHPPENVRLAATDAATYQTFTSTPGTLVNALNRIENQFRESSGPGGQIGAALLRLTIPFRNTPANIFKYTMERTPLAPLMSRYRDAIAQGGAAADIAQTRMALGTMTMLLATDMAFDGHVTGSGPSKNEKGERDALIRSGWQPYSAKIGNRYFAYNRMDPIGFTLGIGADLAEYMKEADYSESTAVEVQKAFTASMFSIANNALNKNYLRGMAEFVEAVNQPDRQGSRYMEKMAGSLVPITATELARSIDPTMRVAHDMVSELKKRTPGLSSDLPALRDLWGRPRTYESGLGAVYDAVSPIYSKREKIEPIDQEMFDQGWFLNMPQRRVGGVTLSNHPEAFSRYLELRGQATPGQLGDKKLAERYGSGNLLDTLNAIVTGNHPLSDEYKKLDGGEAKEKFIRKVRDAYARSARVKLKEEFPKVFEDAAVTDD